jgi:hypothetical protein
LLCLLGFELKDTNFVKPEKSFLSLKIDKISPELPNSKQSSANYSFNSLTVTAQWVPA